MRLTIVLAALMLSLAAARADTEGTAVADVVVLATRTAEHSLAVPASVDRVDGSALREGRLGVNLSEALGPVPGLSVQNRQNYAQDLQLSIRGFGARSSFGARGIRLYADGIPATMPDGQGQFSHFDLTGADRIEILKGPFSALYGNSAGGVIAIFTADAPAGGLAQATADAGSYGTRRYVLRGGGEAGGGNYTLDATHFSTDGYRDHSHAERSTANFRLRLAMAPRTTLTLVANAIGTPQIDDPLGLTQSQLSSNPRQAGTGALLYNTRKSLSQQQAGATLQTQLGSADELTLSTYAGHRATTQFQAILRSIEARNAAHPGGVVDLGRDYRGAELRLTDRRSPAGNPLTITGGISYDVLQEARHGYLNYDGAVLGVLGTLRRDEDNRVRALDEFLQAQWDPGPRWRLVAGVRHSGVAVESRDLLAPVPTLTTLSYSATNPVAGLTYRVLDGVNLYASYGRGFETPTLNDLAYRSTNGALPGLNTALLPARSDNYELGLKAQHHMLRATLAAFQIRTDRELAVQASSGGRSVFENIGRTERRGLEATVGAALGPRLSATLAYTYLRAVTLEPYSACAATPCVLLPVTPGSHLPAVPEHALYASVSWHARAHGLNVGAETVGRSQIYADDRNVNAVPGYWTSNLRLGLGQSVGGWKITETARLDNLFDRRYVGTVIVNESNGRFFEPSPGRTAYLLVNAQYR